MNINMFTRVSEDMPMIEKIKDEELGALSRHPIEQESWHFSDRDTDTLA